MTDDLPIPAPLLAAFPPSADALLARTGELVTDDLLEEISRADYAMDAEAHLAALRPIRDQVRVPAPISFVPHEVLALVRWSDPDDPTLDPRNVAERGHIMRAFCCAALLRAAAEPENEGHFDGENDTLIQLIDSALFLGRGLPEAAGSFLTWRVPCMPCSDDARPFFAFGLTAIALVCRRDVLPSVDVDLLVDFVERAEASFRDPLGICTPDMFEGTFLRFTRFDQRHKAWRALARRLQADFAEFPRVAALAGRIAEG